MTSIADQKSQTIELSQKKRFLATLNGKIASQSIIVNEKSGISNAFEIVISHPLIHEKKLTPSEEMIAIIKDEARNCFGEKIIFNNYNNIFYLGH
jgi:hypothetical protein